MSTPFLTPAQLHRGKKLPPADLVFICFTPFPEHFKKYWQVRYYERYFLHLPTGQVTWCRDGKKTYLVLSEVYGGPVSTSVIEELAYYGVRRVVAIGFAGGLGFGRVGENFMAISGRGVDGATLGYDRGPVTLPEMGWYHHLQQQAEREKFPLSYRQVWTTDALYREYRPEVEKARSEMCSVINMDTRPLFASAERCRVSCVYLGTISDVLHLDDSDNQWEDHLGDAVQGAGRVQEGQSQLIQFLQRHA